MKVTDVETFVVSNPPPSFGGRYFVFVKLTTSEGIVGYGEAYAGTFHPDVVSKMIADVADRHLIGRDPFDVESFWRAAYGRGFTLRPDASLMGVVSALEIACWDIIGKAVDKPVYKLMGGQVHERLRTYTYLYPEESDRTNVYEDPSLAAARAVDYAEMGFTAVKFDPAGPYTTMGGHQPSLKRVERSVEFMRVIRAAVGNEVDLLFGTHGQFTSSGALRLAGKIKDYDPLWFEEPVPPTDVAGMARVAAGTSIPVAAGERLTTLTEFARLLEAGAASIRPTEPRSRWRGPRREEDRHFGRGSQCPNRTPSLLRADRRRRQHPTGDGEPELPDSRGDLRLGRISRTDILKDPVSWENGYVVPPTTPGLGVELDEEVARANPYTGDGLHLDMQERPIDQAD